MGLDSEPDNEKETFEYDEIDEEEVIDRFVDDEELNLDEEE